MISGYLWCFRAEVRVTSVVWQVEGRGAVGATQPRFAWSPDDLDGNVERASRDASCAATATPRTRTKWWYSQGGMNTASWEVDNNGLCCYCVQWSSRQEGADIREDLKTLKSLLLSGYLLSCTCVILDFSVNKNVSCVFIFNSKRFAAAPPAEPVIPSWQLSMQSTQAPAAADDVTVCVHSLKYWHYKVYDWFDFFVGDWKGILQRFWNARNTSERWRHRWRWASRSYRRRENQTRLCSGTTIRLLRLCTRWRF